MIDQAIVDRAGRVLIARRTVLNEFHIQALIKMGIMGIYISEGEEDDEEALAMEISEELQEKIDAQTVQDRTKVNLSESVKARVAEGIQYLYNDTSSKQFTDVTKSITHDLMKAINDNDAIAVDISTLKILFSGHNSFADKVSVKANSISNAAARSNGTYKNNGQYSSTLSDLVSSKLDEEI